DADGDGIDNGMDTCPFTPNLSDPFKASGPGTGDEDNDGIDDACDPDTTGAGASCPGGLTDCDGDLYLNRGDNCPQVANADNADADRDSIGDACDTEGNGPSVADGTPEEVTLQAAVSITGAAATATAAATGTATAAATGTATAAATKTATAAVTKTATATPKASPTATPKASPTASPTAAAAPGGAGLLEEDEGFPWAIVLIVAAAVVLLGGVGTAVLMRGRRP
ncbi:MAG: thrombospondin type 3 repeat-containing protein, partial [Chloroflexota bacterium]|nr:thrombospondin type 3 repeat-containing protein [Chloroflexota bacterium]